MLTKRILYLYLRSYSLFDKQLKDEPIPAEHNETVSTSSLDEWNNVRINV